MQKPSELRSTFSFVLVVLLLAIALVVVGWWLRRASFGLGPVGAGEALSRRGRVVAHANLGGDQAESSVLPSYPTHGPPYDPTKYTRDPYVQNAHNCYAYALDFYDPELTQRCKMLLEQSTDPIADGSFVGARRTRRPTCFGLRPKPGRASRTHQHLPFTQRMTCERIREGVLRDVPAAQRASRDSKCPRHFYKIAFAVDPHRTYHFYRQDADGAWSHKDAWRPVTRTDAAGQRIRDPADADRNYRHARLRDFCGYLCVPTQAHSPTPLL